MKYRTISCKCCGKLFETRYANARYCSDECRQAGQPIRNIRFFHYCVMCGKPITVGRTNQILCKSGKCKDARTKELNEERKRMKENEV